MSEIQRVSFFTCRECLARGVDTNEQIDDVTEFALDLHGLNAVAVESGDVIPLLQVIPSPPIPAVELVASSSTSAEQSHDKGVAVETKEYSFGYFGH